jgi:hypothetical protein
VQPRTLYSGKVHSRKRLAELEPDGLAAQQNVIDIDLSEADKAFIATTLNHELKA